MSALTLGAQRSRTQQHVDLLCPAAHQGLTQRRQCHCMRVVCTHPPEFMVATASGCLFIFMYFLVLPSVLVLKLVAGLMVRQELDCEPLRDGTVDMSALKSIHISFLVFHLYLFSYCPLFLIRVVIKLKCLLPMPPVSRPAGS